MRTRPTLNLVRMLCKALDDEGVAYCHWKSNAALDRSAAGENDLDLLVVRPDVRLFNKTLHRMGFKEALVASWQRMPGVLHYYGYDEDADRFVHVHAHYQLIVGDDMTKNYRLPIERVFVASAIRQDPFRISSPEYELIVLVVRMVLKYRTWDAVLRWQAALPGQARQELQYLMGRIDQRRVREIVEGHLPDVGARLFERCMESLQPRARLWTRIRVGHDLQKALRAHARRGPLGDLCLKFGWRARRVFWRLASRRRLRKRLVAGGAMIAVVGGDGAGKSTAVSELERWLNRHFQTMKVHMGKPRESLISMATAVALRATRVGKGVGGMAEEAGAEIDSADFPGYLWLIRRVAVARRRYRTYVKARRFATNGGLVICDRFPLACVRLMDGPQAGRRVAPARRKGLVGLLVRKEEEYYRPMASPDVLIVLTVDPEIAVRRRREEEAATVRARNREILQSDWRQTDAVVIDASRPSTEVLTDVKAVVWASL